MAFWTFGLFLTVSKAFDALPLAIIAPPFNLSEITIAVADFGSGTPSCTSGLAGLSALMDLVLTMAVGFAGY